MGVRHNIIIGIESFFSTWALIRAFRLGPGNLLSVLIFVGCFLFYKYVIELYISAGFTGATAVSGPVGLTGATARRSLVCSRILGLLFTLFYFLYDRDNYVEDLTNRGFRAIMLLAVLAGFYFLFVQVLRFVYFYLCDPAFTDRVFFETARATESADDDWDSFREAEEESGDSEKADFAVAASDTISNTEDMSSADSDADEMAAGGKYSEYINKAENADVNKADDLNVPNGENIGKRRRIKKAPGGSDGEHSVERVGLIRRISRNYQDHMGAWTFVLCLVFFLPYFLYQFPGIMTPDSIVQFEQVLHIHPYSNHHPWIHTLILGFFYDLGYAFTRNPNISVSVYTVAQMIFMAWSASYVVNTLRLKGFRPLICFLATLFYALVPYNDVFAITIWKDIPFAGVVAVFVCVIIRMDELYPAYAVTSEESVDGNSEEKGSGTSGINKRKLGYAFLLLLFGLGICLLRSNGWYAYIVLTPFLLIHFWKRSKAAIVSVVLALILAAVVKYPVMNMFRVEQPDFVESLSIPVQQVASVIVNGGDIDQDSLYEIQQVVDLTYIDKLYEPTFADNIKELVRAGDQSYLINNKLTFLKIYIKLGLLNPAEFLKAFVMQTYGYFYPDREYNVADAEGVVSSSLEFHTTPLIGGPIVIKSKEILNKLGNMIPLYSVLWCMGAIFWVLLTGMSILIVRGQRSRVIYYLPYLLLVLTVLVATPVANEFRYVYFLMYSIPLIFTAHSIHEH